MKTVVPIFILLAFILSSCTKIKERRLTGSWTLTEWKILTDTSEMDVLTFFPQQFAFDEIRVEFLKDNELIIEALDNGNTTSTIEGSWQEEDKFDYLIFPDSVFLFLPNKRYSVEQLSRGELVLRGPYALLGFDFPKCEWEFDAR